MAFEGHQNMFPNSLFHQYQHEQASISSGSTGSVASSFGSIHSASKNQDAPTFVPWSHDDPRKLADAADWDGETDLLGLVSNIVDEAESPDSYFNDRIMPTCNSIWSPKTIKEGLLQCFQFEPKPQQDHSFFSNCKPHDSFRESQLQSASKDVEESSHLPNGPAANQSLNFPNGDNHPVRTQRAPPGLPIPNTGGGYRPHVQQSKYDRSYGHHVSNVPDLSDIFQPQAELNRSYFDPFYEDHCSQSGMNPTHNEQYVPEAVNQLASSFQSLMPPGENAGCLGGFSNKQETVAMEQDDGVADQWKTTGSASSKHNASGFQIPQRFVGGFQPVLRENNGGPGEAPVKRDAFQDVPDFISDNTQFFQPPKSSFAPVNYPNPYQNMMPPVQKESINDYLKQYFHLSQTQNNVKLQMQKGKLKTQTSGFQGGGLRGRSQNSTSMRAGEKQSRSQAPYSDFQGSAQVQNFEGENGMISAGTTPQFAPAMYTSSDPRRRPSMPFSTAPRYPLYYGNGFSGVNVGDLMQANDATTYFARRGENMYQTPGATSTVLVNQGRSSLQFLICVDECYKQWRCLEKERRMTETFLMKNFPWKKTAAASNSSPSKPAANPLIIDQLIVNQMSEQNKVSSLLDTMECAHQVSLHMSIHTAVSRHQKAICALQASFKEDVAIMSKQQQQQRACFTESNDAVVLMDVALKELTAATKKLRSALWCALQMTVPKPVKTQEHHVNKEAACRERCASPCGGYDFII